MRARPRGLLALLGALLLALVGAAPVLAQEVGDSAPTVPSEVLLIDATDDDSGLLILRHGADPGSVQITVNGQPGSVTSTEPLGAANDGDLGEFVMFVLDNSDTAKTDTAEQLDQLKGVIRDVIADLPATTQFGIITSGGGANLRIGFNPDLDKTLDTLEAIAASGTSQLWDAVKLAGTKFGAERGVAVGSLVIISHTALAEGEITFATARAEVLSQDVETHVIGVANGSIPGGELRALASLTGGSYEEVGNYNEVRSTGPQLAASIGNTYLVSFRSDFLNAGGDLSVAVDGTTLNATFVTGSVTTAEALGAYEVPNGGGIGIFKGPLGLLLGIIAGGLAAGMAAYAFIQLVQKPGSELNSMLQVYGNGLDDPSLDPATRMALFHRAVAVTESIAERKGLLAKTEQRLEQADVPLRAAEALTFYIGIVLAGLVVGFLATRSLMGGLVVTGLAALLPNQILGYKAKKRQKQFITALPDMLTLLASTLKAGYSFMQGVEAVSHEVDGPMGQELRRVVTESQLGRPLEEALEASAERMNSPDFAWAVMAVNIQREVGGNLSELLMTVADTMVARQRLRGEISALTAEGKMSAIVLGLLPAGLGVVMFGINPDYMGKLFDEVLGHIMLGGAILGMVVGFLWMRKIINIDI